MFFPRACCLSTAAAPADPDDPMVPDTDPGPPADAGADEEPATDPGHLGGPRDYSPPDEEDDDFEPEDPPSLAGAEPLLVLAWLGAVGGPLSLLLAAFFWQSAPLVLVLGVVAIFVASAVYLVMRLPQHRDDDDDGAVV